MFSRLGRTQGATVPCSPDRFPSEGLFRSLRPIPRVACREPLGVLCYNCGRRGTTLLAVWRGSSKIPVGAGDEEGGGVYIGHPATATGPSHGCVAFDGTNPLPVPPPPSTSSQAEANTLVPTARPAAPRPSLTEYFAHKSSVRRLTGGTAEGISGARTIGECPIKPRSGEWSRVGKPSTRE